ncbi:Aldo/keto reductase [Cadophora sp. DSE1049]|nr:Aldo/keto reductase [Cadophora sp. DSE1049]
MVPSAPFSVESKVKLNNGLLIPQIRLGVYLTSGKDTETTVRHSLNAGYLAIDSAESYANERECGIAIGAWLESRDNIKGLQRKDLWFTSKVRHNTSYEATRRSITAGLEKSGMEYMDLYLLHSPHAIEDAIADGEVLTGGVSNYGVKHLQELLDSNPRVKPAINQIEVHPFNTQTAITTFCEQHDIAIEAYCPLAQAMRFDHPKIIELSQNYSCTPAQLFISWSLQHGYIALPRSIKQERIVSNVDVAFFGISIKDMEVMDSLDEHLVCDWDPTDVE